MRLVATFPPRANAARVVVATVDHGLRPEARAEAETVAGWAEECGIPHRILTWRGDKPATGLQEAARETRYRLLAGLAHEVCASHVLTAHHRDDQAETVLMRLVRGSGVAGLVGMRPETPLDGVILARPFLDIPKARLLAACRAEGWPFLDDPSNADPAFARTRLRRLLPLLKAEGFTPERLSRLSRRALRWEQVVERSVDRALAGATLSREPDRIVLDGAKLIAEPEEVILQVLSRAMVDVVGDSRTLGLEGLESLTAALARALRSGTALRSNLGGALVAVAADRRITIAPEPPRRRAFRPRSEGDAAGVPHSLGMNGGRA